MLVSGAQDFRLRVCNGRVAFEDLLTSRRRTVREGDNTPSLATLIAGRPARFQKFL